VDDAVCAGADCKLLVGDSASFSERDAEPVRAPVRIPVQLGGRAGHRVERLGERAVRAFVRRELDDTLETELALDLLDPLPGLVRDERGKLRPEKAVVRHSGALPSDFLSQTRARPPRVAPTSTSADLLRPACSPRPGTASFAFAFPARQTTCFATVFPAVQTTQPRTALRLFTIAMSASFSSARGYRTGRARGDGEKEPPGPRGRHGPGS